MRVRNLTKIYKTNADSVLALDNMNLDFPQKGMVFIVGVSGSGKSTLMNILSGVDYPTKGEVFVGNKSLYEKVHADMSGYRNSYVGFIFQDYNLIDDLDVYDNIKLPLEFLEVEDFSIIDDVMKKVEIDEIKHSRVNEISSGQMQRVAIARCLVKNSKIILADEPTGNLDSKNTTVVMDMLKEISNDRLVIVITHDDESAKNYGDIIISLEDGKMIDFTDVRSKEKIEKDTEDVNETLTFKKPKITFKEQCRFTYGFIRNNLARSLAIMIIMVLMPIIGNIMSGYAFFDIADSYMIYQEKYGSEFVNLAQEYNNLEYYYTEEEVRALLEKYPEANFIEKHSTYVNLNTQNIEEDEFFEPILKNVLVTSDFGEYYGTLPTLFRREVMITDYLFESYKYYQGIENYQDITITIDGVNCEVTGVVITSYEKFKAMENMSEYEQMAFEENSEYYNAIIATPESYGVIFDAMESYHENISYIVRSDEGIETLYDEITIYQEKQITPIRVVHQQYGHSDYYIAVSTAFLEEILGTDATSSSYGRVVFTGYSKSRLKLAYHIGAIYESSEKEISLPFTEFEVAKDKMKQCRLMITKDDAEYDEIVRNENVVNPSYNYALGMKQKADNTKISMLQFLVTLVIILVVFSSIVNSMTVASEKKKIGIKYSFGINKAPIIVPYILELALYILIGLTISIVFIKGGVYQAFLRTFIYNTEEQLMEFSFFYIGFETMFGWDLIIYSIMVVSLVLMILQICRKSPIEIIKDL